MTLAWLALGIVVLAVSAYATSGPGPVEWPDEAPLNLHDNRGKDPHLRHLARSLATDSPAETHQTLADITERLFESGSITLYSTSAAARERLGSDVVQFLRQPPSGEHEAYLRRLRDMLARIEQL